MRVMKLTKVDLGHSQSPGLLADGLLCEGASMVCWLRYPPRPEEEDRFLRLLGFSAGDRRRERLRVRLRLRLFRRDRVLLLLLLDLRPIVAPQSH